MKIGYCLLLGCLCACGHPKEVQPLTGSRYGELPNGSAEEVMSDQVKGWSADTWSKGVIYRCDSVTPAREGKNSLCLEADSFAYGRWTGKVNLKPWSVYRFTGWIKCERVIPEQAKGGAGFVLGNVVAQLPVFEGNRDWTCVTGEVKTEGNDCAVVECVLGTEGRAKGKVWFDDMSFEWVSSEEIETVVSVNPQVKKEEMSPYIYGQFIEHLGRCIYGGIWAEMLEDRKFWYAPGDRESPWKVVTDKPEEEILSMDTKAPFTGEHTPVLVVKEKGVGLEQGHLGLRKGVNCSGYVILKADKKMPVKVSLKGEKGMNQEVVIEVGTSYQKYPIHFSVSESTHEAVFSIHPQDEGNLWIGTASLMPDDQVKGFRADVLALMKGLKAPVYRWPGGNFVSGYDWHDGIGDRDKRPPRKNPAWKGVEHNDVGIHEFMQLCELLETEPYIAVNAGLGGVEEAAREVEYCNGAADTPMGRKRAQNGHPEPWQVKWWSVGNEMYGDWQLGHTSTEAFVARHNAFAKAMRTVDPEIRLIAVGNVGPWDEMMLKHCAGNMDLISEHFYCQDWHGGGLRTHVMQIPNSIRSIAEAHRKYRQDMERLSEQDIRICMDEWNYWYGPHVYGELGTRYFLRDALGIAAGLNEFLRQSDMVFMANYAQTVNVIGCIKTNTTEAVYATTGQVLKMYREHFGTIPVELGGELRPLDVAAAVRNSDGALTIAVVNPGWERVTFRLDLPQGSIGKDWESGALIHTLTGPDDMVYNEPGMEERVKLTSEKIDNYKEVSVAPFSANIVVILPVK